MEFTEVNLEFEVSLNSLVSLTTLKTLKIKGTVVRQKVFTLIDMEATYNLISLVLVEKLQLPTTNIFEYSLIIGSGSVVRDQGICRGVALQLPGTKI